jgi:hypothetical protein
MVDGLRDAIEDFPVDATWAPGAMRTELVAATNGYVEAELARWAEEMGTQVQGDLERLVTRIGDDAAGIDASLRRIRLQMLEGGEPIMPTSEAAGHPNDVIETILALGGARLLGDIDVLLAGGPGWLNAALRVVAFNLAAGAVVTAVGLAGARSSPWPQPSARPSWPWSRSVGPSSVRCATAWPRRPAPRSPASPNACSPSCTRTSTRPMPG